MARPTTRPLTEGWPTLSSRAVSLGSAVPRERLTRVAYLTNQLPWPAHSGGQVRESQILERLGSLFDVDLFVVTETFERDASALPLSFPSIRCVRLYDSEAGDHGRRGLGQRGSYGSAELDADFAARVGSYDLVHVEGYFLMGHMPAGSGRPVVLVEENIEYLLVEQAGVAFGYESGGESVRTERAEQAAWDRASRIVVLTREDAEVAQRSVPGERLRLVENGHGHALTGGAGAVHDLSVVTVGNFDWWPTREGLRWLVDEVWPIVLRVLPDARLRVVGAGNASGFIGRQNVEIVGTVPEIGPYLAGSAVFAGPSRFGSGIKVKMLEALDAGCAIVATAASLRGLPQVVREAVVVADEPSAFADGIVQLLTDESAWRRLRARVAAANRKQPTWDDAARALERIWLEVAAEARRNPP